MQSGSPGRPLMGDAGPGELGPTEYRSVAGLRVELAGSVLSLTLDRPERRNAIDDSMMARAHRRAGRGRPRRGRTGDRPARRRRPLLRRGRHRRPQRSGRTRARAPAAIQRRLPTQAHRLIPLLITVQVPVVCEVKGWAAGHRLPAGAGRGLHDRRRRRPPLGAVHRPGVHARQRRHLAAAAPGRRGAGPRAAPARPGAVRAEAAEWGLVHRAVPAARGGHGGRRARGPAGRGTDRRPRPDQVAARRGRRARPRAAAAQRGVRPRALLAHDGLPRGPPAFGERRTPDFGGR